MRLINGTFYSHLYIFIKGGFRLSDKEIIKALDAIDYQLTKLGKLEEAGDNRYLHLTEDAHWAHLMDDLVGTLLFNQQLQERLSWLSKDFDVFCWSVGDIDDSFDFRYYQNGSVIREYVVEDPKFNGGKITRNSGRPLAGEKDGLAKKDSLEKVLTIASSLGINLKHDLSKIRCYERPELASEQFVFNEDEY